MATKSPIPTASPALSSSPWGKTPMTPPITCSFHDVMSEQLASDLQHEEEDKSSKERQQQILDDAQLAAALAGYDTSTTSTPTEAASVVTDKPIPSDTGSLEDSPDESDLLLAQVLQHEYNKEFDKLLSAQEHKLNSTNKVAISFENYRAIHPQTAEEDDGSDDEDDDDDEEYVGWENEDNSAPNFTRGGISGKGKNITTKHDANICGRRNAERLMDFPPEFAPGDSDGINLKLANHVYNKLKSHSISEAKRAHRLHEKKEHSTAEHAMDARTRLVLYKLVSNGILESVSGSISTGKESVVFHAYGGKYMNREEAMPEECAIKVYKTSLADFKTREKYVHGDHRFARDDFKKQNPRKIMKLWAAKEVANLKRMRKFGVPCPNVLLLQGHVLVMPFIGKDQIPAPKLLNARLSDADLQDAYEQTVQIMKTIHDKCGLVHADLSEFNMLWFNDQVWIIDVSQSVEIPHPMAYEFLLRDCTNVSKFFTKKGVYDVPSPQALFNDISGLNLKGEGKEFLIQVQKYDSAKTSDKVYALSLRSNDFSFDYFFDDARQQRQDALKKLDLDQLDDEDADKAGSSKH